VCRPVPWGAREAAAVLWALAHMGASAPPAPLCAALQVAVEGIEAAVRDTSLPSPTPPPLTFTVLTSSLGMLRASTTGTAAAENCYLMAADSSEGWGQASRSMALRRSLQHAAMVTWAVPRLLPSNAHRGAFGRHCRDLLGRLESACTSALRAGYAWAPSRQPSRTPQQAGLASCSARLLDQGPMAGATAPPGDAAPRLGVHHSNHPDVPAEAAQLLYGFAALHYRPQPCSMEALAEQCVRSWNCLTPLRQRRATMCIKALVKPAQLSLSLPYCQWLASLSGVEDEDGAR
jgi:hypothetical protein